VYLSYCISSSTFVKLHPSSQLYHKFDLVVVLSHGRSLYSGPGSFAPAEYFSTVSPETVPPYQQGYNVAEYLLEIASDPPVSLFQMHQSRTTIVPQEDGVEDRLHQSEPSENVLGHPPDHGDANEKAASLLHSGPSRSVLNSRSEYETTFLTQLQYLCGREWKILKRDKSLFLTHVIVSAILGVFCGKRSLR
jgi:hypothetical protein